MNKIIHSERAPKDKTFWELFDFMWVRGLGNALREDGTEQAWTASSLEAAFGGSPDKRTIENWQRRANMPSPESLMKLSVLIAAGDDPLRKEWYGVLSDARLEERRREKEKASPTNTTSESSDTIEPTRRRHLWVGGLLIVGVLGLLSVLPLFVKLSAGPIENMRICDAAYFDNETKDCTKHVDVFVHGVDEVFLSFDFNGIDEGTPFERWWIHNGERVAGRTSFNDEAWPGYTFWRPGTLQVGQYVVRLVVNGEVTSQTFYVQAEGFTSDE